MGDDGTHILWDDGDEWTLLVSNKPASPSPIISESVKRIEISGPVKTEELIALELEHKFDGEWRNVHGEEVLIDGKVMNGERVFTVIDETHVQLVLGDTIFEGEARKGGDFIRWDDTDEWVRLTRIKVV